MTSPLTTSLTHARLLELLSYDEETGVFRWRAARGPHSAGAVAGSPCSEGYIRITIDSRSYKAHRLAWLYTNGKWPCGQLDHEDRNKTRNCLKNLRPATQTQNNANRETRIGASGFRGVLATSEGKPWYARISVKNHDVNLGRFDRAEDAARAYDRAAKQHHGKFAILNFPEAGGAG